MTRSILTESDVATLVTDLVGTGTRVIAPVPVGPDLEQTEYRPIERLDQAALSGAQPRRSLKEFFRPSEREDGTPPAPQVVLGARPCDAAGVETLDQVMGWDYRDEQWLARREATTIVTVACPTVERSCFCSAVGIGPDSTRGSDAILIPLDAGQGPPTSQRRVADAMRRCVDMFLFDLQPFDGAAELQAANEAIAPRWAAMRWVARSLTPKGDALLRGRGTPVLNSADLEQATTFTRGARRQVADNLVALRLAPEGGGLGAETEARLGLLAADGGELVDPSLADGSTVKRLPEWLARNFDHEVWRSLAPKCRGCGTCAAVCSTSPCFDVDEPDRRARRSAGTPPGATGRTPAYAQRPMQTERFRQRVIHKFSIYPRRFDSVLCTGCGRCSRACEGGMNLPEILGDLVQLAAPEARGAVR